jgi:hypothetical protein
MTQKYIDGWEVACMKRMETRDKKEKEKETKKIVAR